MAKSKKEGPAVATDPPDLREDEQVITVTEYHNQTCEVRMRGAVGPSGWVNLCVIAPGVYKTLIRYWLGWNIYEQRFAKSQNRVDLEARHPELYRWLEEALPEFWQPR